jgi:hypothetical protein
MTQLSIDVAILFTLGGLIGFILVWYLLGIGIGIAHRGYNRIAHTGSAGWSRFPWSRSRTPGGAGYDPDKNHRNAVEEDPPHLHHEATTTAD